MKRSILLLGAFALAGVAGCGDTDPVSSTPSSGEPSAKLVVSAARVGGTAERPPVPGGGIIWGETAAIFGAPVSTWARLGVDGSVDAVGFDIPLAAIEGAPSESEEPEIHFELAFPKVAVDNTFVDHLEIGWNPQGHPPVGVYTLPHFDFHFYSIDATGVGAIDCGDLTLPEADQVPANYVLAPPGLPPEGDCVPMMGIHAVDVTSPELDPEAPEVFTRTMILGYYGGAMNFIEPMITRDFLAQRQSFSLDIPAPDVLGTATLYPTTFTAVYRASSDRYQFVLEDFTAIE